MTCPDRHRRLGHGAAALVLLAWLAVPIAASAAPPSTTFKYASVSAGFRQSFTLGEPGLDLRLGLGGTWGLFGVELETGWTATEAWLAVEGRTAARTTTWLGPQLMFRPLERMSLSFGVSPGLGWIKNPADETDPHPRWASVGVREYVQLGFFAREPLGLFSIAMRVELQQLGQSGIVEGVEHALCLRMVMTVGEIRDIED